MRLLVGRHHLGFSDHDESRPELNGGLRERVENIGAGCHEEADGSAVAFGDGDHAREQSLLVIGENLILAQATAPLPLRQEPNGQDYDIAILSLMLAKHPVEMC